MGGECTFSGSLQVRCSSVLGPVPSYACGRPSLLQVCPGTWLGGFTTVWGNAAIDGQTKSGLEHLKSLLVSKFRDIAF